MMNAKVKQELECIGACVDEIKKMRELFLKESSKGDSVSEGQAHLATARVMNYLISAFQLNFTKQ